MLDFFDKVAWHPGIGDPTIMGWFTVFAYLIASILSFRVSISANKLYHYTVANKQRIFWLGLSILLTFLTINKQLDLQSLFTAIGKYYAHQYDWYQNRRVIQKEIIIAILAFGFLVFVLMILMMRTLIKSNYLAVTGIVFLFIFIAIRATSFHHMDIFINSSTFGIKMNWLLELSGIFAVIISALQQFKKQ